MNGIVDQVRVRQFEHHAVRIDLHRSQLVQTVGEVQIAVGVVRRPTAAARAIASAAPAPAATATTPVPASAVARGILDAHEREDILGELLVGLPVGHAAPVVVVRAGHSISGPASRLSPRRSQRARWQALGLSSLGFSLSRHLQEQLVAFTKARRIGKSLQDVPLRGHGVTLLEQPGQTIVDIDRIGRVEQEQMLVCLDGRLRAAQLFVGPAQTLVGGRTASGRPRGISRHSQRPASSSSAPCRSP